MNSTTHIHSPSTIFCAAILKHPRFNFLPHGATLPKLMINVFVLLKIGLLGTKEFLIIITRAIIFLVSQIDW
jgi:hypothetical protein